MKILEVGIIVIFALSLLANTCFVIFNRQLVKHTARWDLFCWISSYRLFWILPRHYRLFYRDKLEDGQLTDWCELPFSLERKWYQTLVFPERQVSEDIYTCVQDIVTLKEEAYPNQAIFKSFYFETLLNYVRRFPSREDSVGLQFRIVEYGGFLLPKEQKQILISDFSDK